MPAAPSEKFAALINSVRRHPDADFYRTLWGSADEFSALPTISREDFVRVPLSRRRYKDAPSLTKVVHAPEGVFLSEWCFDDIGREPWGMTSVRPLVYLDNAHEAVEKSLWCYAHNLVPLIGEKNIDITFFAAQRYDIDSLIVDLASLMRLEPYLAKRTTLLSTMTIINSSFDPALLMAYHRYAKQVRLLFAFSETGAIAQALLTATPRFVLLPDWSMDISDTLIVTRTSPLVTPIIRYRTGTVVSGDPGERTFTFL
jgi:hypothetical protein